MDDPLTPQAAWIVPSEWENSRERKLLYGTMLLVLVGVIWRVVRYLLCFPIWGDEAFLVLNFLDADYLSLTGHLDHCQVSPLLFLWGELSILRLFGSSEYALRLLPFLACLASLALFARLAWLTLTPYGRLISVGIMAVAYSPVSMGSHVKPYAFDLLMALFLMVPAVRWLQKPDRRRWLVILTALVPITLLSSYPAVFIAGGVSLALLRSVWRSRDWRTYSLFGAYNLLMLVTFVGHYLLIGGNQLSSPINGVTTEVGMHRWWGDMFPPYEPLAFLKWFVLVHTGEMMSFPIGDANGGSVVTSVLLVAGIVALWKLRRHELLILCLSPFVLGLIAALWRKYPYGAGSRISQSFAPSIALLAGAGATYLLHRWWDRAETRQRAAFCAAGLLLLIGVAGISWHVVRPYREAKDVWVRQIALLLLRDVPPGAPIAVMHHPPGPDPVLTWYLRQKTDNLAWNDGTGDLRSLTGDKIWCVQMMIGDPATFPPWSVPDFLQQSWWQQERVCVEHPREREPDQIIQCQLSSWTRRPSANTESQGLPRRSPLAPATTSPTNARVTVARD